MMKVISEKKEIIWCPSQIYIIVEWGGQPYQIYARWRHGDPWSIMLSTSIANPYDGHKWYLENKIFCQDDDIDEIVEYMKDEAEEVLKEYFPLNIKKAP